MASYTEVLEQAVIQASIDYRYWVDRFDNLCLTFSRVSAAKFEEAEKTMEEMKEAERMAAGAKSMLFEAVDRLKVEKNIQREISQQQQTP